MAMIFDREPPLSGPPPSEESASSWLAYRRLRNAFRAALSCSGVGGEPAGPVGEDMACSFLNGPPL
jgi:hypothetical protein